jgi:hypothetical protein
LSEQDAKRPGLWIFRERRERGVVDPADEVLIAADWQPANTAATKLWYCLEPLRDIHEMLGAARETSKPKNQRRRLKLLATPLLTLAQNVQALCNCLETDPDYRDVLTPHQRKQVRMLREAFEKDVPLGPDSPLKVVRDKLSAHMDKKMRPERAREILDSTGPSVLGSWLHGCLYVLEVVLASELPVFFWRSSDAPEGCIRLMHYEPHVLTIEAAPETTRLVGYDIGSRPSRAAYRLIEDIVRDSQWLFKKGERHLRVDEEVARENRRCD